MLNKFNQNNRTVINALYQFKFNNLGTQSNFLTCGHLETHTRLRFECFEMIFEI